jgi:hypothetical protein
MTEGNPKRGRGTPTQIFCAIPGCPSKVLSRSYAFCQAHYREYCMAKPWPDWVRYLKNQAERETYRLERDRRSLVSWERGRDVGDGIEAAHPNDQVQLSHKGGLSEAHENPENYDGGTSGIYYRVGQGPRGKKARRRKASEGVQCYTI